MKHTPLLILNAVMLLWMQSISHASLLVYEGYNYTGTVADGGAINGAAVSATGLTGSYAYANSGGSGTTSANYNSTGLSFGSNYYSVTGGALTVTATNSSGSIAAYVGAKLNASTTGTLYQSYLVNFGALGSVSASAAGSKLNTSSATAGYLTAYFTSGADSANSLYKPAVGYGLSGLATEYTGSFTLSTNTTYLVISKFTNVGAALTPSTPGVSTLWLFTLSSYNDWTAAGGVEANIQSYANASVSNSLTTGTMTFDGTDYLQWVVGSGASGGTESATFDELRFGTTLSDVVSTVPEPSTEALIVAAMLFVILRKRKLSALM